MVDRRLDEVQIGLYTLLFLVLLDFGTTESSQIVFNHHPPADQFLAVPSLSVQSCGCTGYETNFHACNFTFHCHSTQAHCHDCVTAPRDRASTGGVTKILVWNSRFDDVGLYRSELVQNCPVRCEIFNQQRRLSEAHALIFSIIYSTSFPPRRNDNQMYIAHCMESETSYFGRLLRDKNFMQQFDLKVTYKKIRDPARSDYLWASYAPLGLWKNTIDGRLPPVLKSQYQEGLSPVVWIASNCNVERRNKYMQDLMEFIQVDSYGACLHNKDFPQEGSGRHDALGPERKIELIGKYKFTIAFENSWTPDYVTEKFFQALLAGSVPVVMGAPNIDEYAPAPHSYIDVKDYPSPQKLAEYLHELDKNDELYFKYHEWRTSNWNQSFSDLLHTTYHSVPCRVCMAVAAKKQIMYV